VVTVKYDELLEAFDFVSFAAPMEHQAYIDRTTGEIYWVSEAVDDELPEDLDESDRYITIPHKNDLDWERTWRCSSRPKRCPTNMRESRGSFNAAAHMRDSRNFSQHRAAWNNGTHSKRNAQRRLSGSGVKKTT
jgi:hypothetical protein